MNPLRLKLCRLLLPCLMALALAAPACAGWIMDESAPDESTSRVWFAENRVRHQMGDKATIFDIKANRICVIDLTDKTYWCGPPEEIRQEIDRSMAQAMGGKAKAGGGSAMDKMLEEQLKQLPPEQREQVKKAMEQQLGRKIGQAKPSAPPKVEIKKTDISDEVAKYRATKYEIWVDGLLCQEMWISPKIRIAKLIDMDRMAKMTKAMQGDMTDDGFESSPQVMALWKKGYPLIRVDYVDGKGRMTETISVNKQKIPDSMFEPPAGFRAVSVMEAFQ